MSSAYKTKPDGSPVAEASGLRVAITGGTSGLGLALVREFLTRGAEVAFIARNAERVAQVTREIEGTHGIVGDVSDKESILPDRSANSRPARGLGRTRQQRVEPWADAAQATG